MRIDNFRGIRQDKPSRALKEDEFQTLLGTDRFDTSRLKRRKGMLKTDLPVAAAAIETILGFEIPGGFPFVTVAGANAAGYSAVQTLPVAFSTLNLTKLANPSTLPSGAGSWCKWDRSGDHLLVLASDFVNPPEVVLYSRSGTTFTKLSNPATLPGGAGDIADGASWNEDSSILAITSRGGTASPYIYLYSFNGTTLTKLSDPATLPTGSGWDCDFTRSGSHLAVAHSTSPYFTVYSVSGTTFTKLADPATLPAGTIEKCSWSDDGQYLALLGHSFIYVYRLSGSTLTLVTSSDSLASANAADLEWRPHDGSGTQYLYVWDRTTTRTISFDGTSLSALASETESGAAINSAVSWSADGGYGARGTNNSPYLIVNEFDTTSGMSALPSVSDTPGSRVLGVDWSPTGEFLAVATLSTPYVSIYQNSSFPSALATISTLTPNHRADATALKRMGYLVNGWDKARRWNGRSSSFELAGIAGPSTEIDSWTPSPYESSGNGTAGLHYVRYRYLESRTGYVSEPSEEREVEITSGNGKLTFPVGNAESTIGPDAGTGFAITGTNTITRNDGGNWATDGVQVGDFITIANANTSANNGTWGPVSSVDDSTDGDIVISSGGLTNDAADNTATFDVETAYRIVPSTDSKVDKIVIEMGTVNGTVFYYAVEAANTANAEIEVNVSDPELEASFLEWPDTGHLPPPVARNCVGFRERLWLFGQVIHSTGNCDVTNASTDVGEGSTDPDWRASALGDSTASPATYSDVAWFFQVDGDTAFYEVDHYDESASKIVLKTAYQGSTDTDVSYKLFSRANVLWVSNPGYPEGFSAGGFLDGFEFDLTAAMGAGPSLAVCGLSGIDLISWDQGPLVDPVRRSISRQRGALNNRVLVEVDQTIFGMDHKGWWSWSGGAVRDIGKALVVARDEIDFSDLSTFHAVYLPKIRAIRWFNGTTYYQLDLDTGGWGTGTYNQTIKESALVPTSSGLEVFYGDDQGWVFKGQAGTADGIVSSSSRATVGAGASTTEIPISGAPLLADQATGLYAYHLEGQEARRISASIPGQITVASAFSSAPASGDTIWVGPIPFKAKFKAVTKRKSGRKASARNLWVEFTPVTGTRYLQLRVYSDLSPTAQPWATGTRNNLDGSVFPGNNTSYPSTDWLLNLSESDGHSRINIGNEFKRAVEIELEMNEPDCDLEVLSIEFEGWDLEDEQ